MKASQAALQSILMLSLALSKATPCPMANTGEVPPNDDIHIGLQKKSNLRRRIVSLTDSPDTKAKLHSIINDRKQRNLQEECITTSSYDAIDTDVAAIAALFPDNESKSHFLGGIVRLAAHDFLDYNVSDQTTPYGPDGCIDFNDQANAGLEDIWCTDCDLTTVYLESYSHISRADFWVAAANAVIRQTSNDGLNLKSTFTWGRIDNEECPSSAARLPEATGCSEVEEVFLNRLGLSYTDAVALIGAHTLGRGNENFSGHHGIWVDTVEESLVFDKRFYEEIIRRPWIPRNLGADNEDWTWGNPNNGGSPRFMLHTDMCLLFDIEQTFPCCSRTDRFNNAGENQCGDLSETLCASYDEVNPRSAAADAVNLFATGGGNNIGNELNGPFFAAFEVAWIKATTNGWTDLRQLGSNCDPITLDPTVSPTQNPTANPTVSPTQHPTASPNTSSPTTACHDVTTFVDNKGKERECPWVVDGKNKCQKFAHLCRVTCGECECLLAKRMCSSGEDCCSGECDANGQCTRGLFQ